MNQDERFEILYRRYYARVVRYLVANFRFDQEAAADITQDVFLRVLAVPERHWSNGEWRFIETVTRNLVLNRWRDANAKKRGGGISVRPIKSADQVTNTPDKPSPQEQAFAVGEMAVQLYAAIDKLPPEHRAVLFLQLSDFTFVEIAQALGIALPIVKARLWDARARLRELLGGEEMGPELIASVADSAVVPFFARQKLSASSFVPETASSEEAIQELLERTEALAAQQQHLSRQLDEYEVMLTRHLGTLTDVVLSSIR